MRFVLCCIPVPGKAQQAVRSGNRRRKQADSLLQNDQLSVFYQQRAAAGDGPKDLAELLANEKLRVKFRAFLRKRLAHESLMLWECIQLYHRIDKDSWRQRSGQGMITRFVKAGAENEVNLPGDLRQALLETTKFLPNTFDAAERELEELMSSNFFVEFVQREFVDGRSTGDSLPSPDEDSAHGSSGRVHGSDSSSNLAALATERVPSLAMFIRYRTIVNPFWHADPYQRKRARLATGRTLPGRTSGRCGLLPPRIAFLFVSRARHVRADHPM